jgi:hypothetical protein
MANGDDTPATTTGTPRNMRPRASPNAEINAQRRDQSLRDMGKGYDAPTVADVPLRGYRSGGKVITTRSYCKGGKVISSKNF